MTTHYVYWYRLKEHSDPHRDGYIGITNDIGRRCKQHRYNHKSCNKNNHFYNALNKYGYENVLFEVLHQCTSDEALELEFYYRSENNIGWNTATGGEDTLKSIRSVEVTLYHKDNPEKTYTYESATEASKDLGIKNARISKAIRNNITVYGYDGWAVLLDKSIDRTKTKTIGEVISEKLTGIKRSKPSHFKGMTSRWSEEDKKRISKQHKGKKISKEQIEITRKKNMENHSSCKSITLVHKDTPDVEHTYHSISEAARQLDMPLPRLKSKCARTLGNYGKDGWKVVKLGAE